MKKSLLFIMALFLSLNTFFAQSGKNLEFDGVGRYMKIPNHADFNIAANESFTVSMWINAAEFTNSNARFLAKRQQGTTIADKSGYELFGTNSAAQYYATNTPNAAGNHNNSLSAWSQYTGSTGKWTHIAFVVDRGTGKMYQYIDGVEVINSGTKDISPWVVNNTFDVYVGCGISGATTGTPSNFFKGMIDEVRIWKKALSATEIQADKTGTVTATTEGLVAAYDFESITGTTVTDIKGNHPATLVGFPEPGNIKITGSSVAQDINFTGRGNDNEEILKIQLNTTGTTSVPYTDLVMNLSGTTDINDIEEIKIYTTRTSTNFDSRKLGGFTALLATVTPAEGEMTVPLTGNITPGNNNLWLTFKVKESATEGNKLDASVVSIATETETHTFDQGNPAGSREIMLRRTLVYAPGDYGSTNYRIPAITTAADGSLVALTDKRKFGAGDLAANIDVVANRSTDGGKTWSEPVTVALGTSTNTGFGDAAIIKANSGKLIALYVGGPGFFSSTASNPIRSYISTSSDNGITWTAPRNITSQIYGAGCTDPVRATWQGSFFGSGHQLALRSGRLMAVIAVREPSVSGIQNYAVYSDDEGETWSVSKRALSGGDEAKVVELNDGTILMSVRTGGNRLWTKSSDGGITWGPKNSWQEIWGNACDADIIRFTSTKDGFDKDRILHTLPNAIDRRNVTMWISYDEGTTWPVKRTIAPGTSAYSSATILPDGTIGVYLEEDESVPYKMYFLNFSLDWLTNGADSYTVAGTEIVAQPELSLEGGKYSTEQTVTITSATTDAKIYYTLDGSTPSAKALLYTEPLVLKESAVLKAIAIKEGMANSVVVSATYLIGNYIVNYAPSTTQPRTDRSLNNISFTGNQGGTLSVTLPTESPRYLYNDMTEIVGYAVPGETLTPKIGYTGNWMHGYVFLDILNDGNFNENLTDEGVPATGSDIMSFSFYKGKNSLGNTTANENPGVNPPVFTIPSDIAPGVYRIRYKVDWNSVDAGGSTEAGNDIVANGGEIADALVNIHSATSKLTVITSNGTVLKPDNSALPAEITFGISLELLLTPSANYKLDSIIVKHGYLSNSEFINGNRQWRIDRIPASEVTDNKYTIPATMVDGDVEITAKFTVSSSVNELSNTSNIDIKTDKNTLNLTTQSETKVLISDVAGRIHFAGNLSGNRIFKLQSGVYFVNKHKVLIP